jgi:hypothetical protein
MNKELLRDLRKAGFNCDYRRGWYLNIARKDGLNCEFYPSGPNDEVFCATYTIDGKEKDLDFYLPDDLGEFVAAVKNILS